MLSPVRPCHANSYGFLSRFYLHLLFNYFTTTSQYLVTCYSVVNRVSYFVFVYSIYTHYILNACILWSGPLWCGLATVCPASCKRQVKGLQR